jgi:leader peptidase (prepilin peptidase)/N-methyltransferase
MSIKLLLVVIGLAFGSFANVLIGRFNVKKDGKNEIDLNLPSNCDSCNERIAWYDLIPVVSYIILRGRCRKCESEIPKYTPWVELAGGLLALGTYISFGISLGSILLFFVGILMIVIFVYDWKNHLIPDYYIYAGVALGVLYNINLAISGNLVLIDLVYALLVGSGFLYLLNIISAGKWMGMGDVKLMLVVGLILGWPLTGVQIYLSFILGGIIGLILIIVGNKDLKSQVSFGPILIAGYFVSLFYGNEILNYVFNHFIYL